MVRMTSGRPSGSKSHSGRRSRRTSHGLPPSATQVEERRRDRRLAARRVVRVDNPDEQTLRAYIREQTCWWCGAGPFKVLAAHVWRHGITANEVRDLAGLFYSTPICSPEHSERLRETAKRRHSVGNFRDTRFKKRTAAVRSKAAQTFIPHVLSEAAKISARERILAASSPEQRRRAAMASALVTSKPHPCTNPFCTNIVPRATRKTCSPECRLEVRKQTGGNTMRLLNKQGHGYKGGGKKGRDSTTLLTRPRDKTGKWLRREV